jgi:hypothetical protein
MLEYETLDGRRVSTPAKSVAPTTAKPGESFVMQAVNPDRRLPASLARPHGDSPVKLIGYFWWDHNGDKRVPNAEFRAHQFRQVDQEPVGSARQPQGKKPPPSGSTPRTAAENPDLVTLNQIAGIVKRTKRTLERYKTKGLPAPAVEGRPGQYDLWDWPTVRPWLEETFNMKLPEAFPANR